MTDISPLHVPSQCNLLYCKPYQLANPSAQGERVRYEKKEFTDWINSYLQQISHSSRISDLQEGIADGITLLLFVQQISFEAPPCIHPKPALYMHRLENIEACLLFMDGLGVDMSSVYAEDIARGNIKTILALCRAVYIRFEGDMMEDHRCLSPVLSWKHKSPSSLGASILSDFSCPQYPWKQGDTADTSTETTSPDGIFTVWYKEDMAVIGWIRRLLGQDLKDYSEFADGILLCAVVNQLWDGSISQEEVLFSSPLERLQIATEAAEQYLGVPQPEIDLKAVIAGQGREALPWYLLELKATSEQMFQEYMAMVEERDMAKNEEETVNRMGRHVIRQHVRELAAATSTANPTTRPTSDERPLYVAESRPQKGARNDPKMNSSLPKEPICSSHRTDVTDERASRASLDVGMDHLGGIPRRPEQTRKDSKSGGNLKPSNKHSAVSFAEHSNRVPDTHVSSGSLAKYEILETVEQLETSLSSLMQTDSSVTSFHQPGTINDEKEQQVGNYAQPVPSNTCPSLIPPPRSETQSVTKQLPQPDVSSFFSPFSMPFVSIGGRKDASSRYGNTARNSSSSVLEDDSLARGKLTSWSDKNVKESQSRDVPVTESPQKPTWKHSATIQARLAARSPGGLAGMTSSDVDE